MDKIPTIHDVLRARHTISRYLSPTPLYHYRTLDDLVGAEVWVKHENHQPTGAFKVRGGINLISQLSDAERKQGVITASTGNHAQSIAYASHLFGVRALIVMPEGANPGKVAATRSHDAEVIFHGKDFDEAREFSEALAREKGYRFIHAGNEPLLIAGVGTHTLEILEQQPGIEVIIVPVGGGSGASGACIVAKSVDRAIQVIAVQAKNAPAAYLSWKEGRIAEAQMKTFAEGLATRVGFDQTQAVMHQYLDDFVLVSEAEMRQAMRLMLENTHNLAEAAGAAPLAAALQIKERLQGKRVALILSGGNSSTQHLMEALSEQA